MKKLYCSLLTLFILLTTNLQAQNWWNWSMPLQSPYNNVVLDNQNNYITISGKGYSQWDQTNEFSLKKYDRNGSMLWQKTGGVYAGSTSNVTVDDSGNIYTTGLRLDNAANYDIIKFDAEGNKQWALNFLCVVDGVSLSGMHTTPEGDVYIAGTYYVSLNTLNDSIRLGGIIKQVPHNYPANQVLVIAKINSQGVPQWLQLFPFNSLYSGQIAHSAIFSSLTTDSNSHLYMSGQFAKGYFNLDTIRIDAGIDYTGFVMQMNSNTGKVKWAKSIEPYAPTLILNNGGEYRLCYVAAQGSDAVLLGGDDGYITRLGGDNIYNSSYYLRSYDTSGNERWRKHLLFPVRSLVKKGDYYYTHGIDSLAVIDSLGNFIKKAGTPGITGIAASAIDKSIGAIRKYSADGGYTYSFFVSKYLENSNKISGYVFKDTNNNGIKDSAEQVISGVIVGETPNRYVGISGRNGYYECYVDSGSHAIEPLSDVRYNTYSPIAGYNVSFAGFGDVVTGKDFAYTPIPGITDLQINLTPYSRARPGFTALYNVSVKNNGTETATGTTGVKLPAGITFIADTNFAAPVFSSADSVAFQFSNLQPQAEIYFNFKCLVSSSLAIGSVLDFYSAVLPAANDSFPSDNYDTLIQWTSGSYDPNDKMVFPDGDINIAQKDKPLTYVIRFQNTGNDTAFNVHVIDTLSSKLDIASLQIVGSSHPVNITIEKNNVLHFYFDNINLIDSVHNESLSHGFIRFKIKSTSTVNIGDTILNQASIYFDYNAAVATNTTSTKYFSIVLPVTIRSFTALNNKENVLLNLQAGTEVVMTNFEVERSSDGLQFSSIGNVQASMLQHTYNFIDRQPMNGMNYYRLKLIAADGSLTYTNVQAVQFSKSKTSFSVYPNPATNMLYLNTTATEKTTYKIYNTEGQVLFQVTKQNTSSINISNLAEGIYYIEANTQGTKTTQKFIVKR